MAQVDVCGECGQDSYCEDELKGLHALYGKEVEARLAAEERARKAEEEITNLDALLSDERGDKLQAEHDAAEALRRATAAEAKLAEAREALRVADEYFEGEGMPSDYGPRAKIASALLAETTEGSDHG